MGYSTPFSYERHLYYIDFSDYNVSKAPIYINLIRDPIDRIISDFFYRREPSTLKRKRKLIQKCDIEKDAPPMSNKVIIYFISINN